MSPIIPNYNLIAEPVKRLVIRYGKLKWYQFYSKYKIKRKIRLLEIWAINY